MDPYRDIAEFYDLEHEDFRDDVEFYLHMVSEGPVLEVGVGTGRVLAPLLDAGLEVWGVDLSSAMLERAAQRRHDHPGMHLVHASAEDLDLSTVFRVALFPLNTLWHVLDSEGQIAALRAVRRHMEDGGRLIVDCANPLTVADRGASGEIRYRFERQLSDRRVVCFSASRDDEAEQRLSISLIYDETMPDKQLYRTETHLELRYVYRFELELLLRLSGFRVRHLYGSYDLEPYSGVSPQLIVDAVAD